MGTTQLPGFFSGGHSIFYYVLLLAVGAVALQVITTGILFFFKRSGEMRANACFGTMLIAFGLTQVHYIFLLTGLSRQFPVLSVLPLYYTLLFPPLLFYYIKLSLYPAYRFRWTDAKHFFLPLGQCLFFVFLTISNTSVLLEREFFNPFYGGVETALYLLTFFAYLYFGYRFIRQKREYVRLGAEIKLTRYLGKLVKVLFFLLCVHSALVVSDFLGYEILQLNLRFFKPFAAIGILSFTVMGLWLGIYGFQVLVWGRKVLQ